MDASETVRQFLLDLRTEPLSAADLSRYFGMGRNAIKPDLLPTLDVVQVGSRYRVLVSQMPLAYFREIESLHRIARSCTEMQVPADCIERSN